MGTKMADKRDDIIINLDNLSDATKEFLVNLRDEDIEDINYAIQLTKTLRTMGTVMKWLSITIVAVFVGAASLGDAIVKLKAYLLQMSGH